MADYVSGTFGAWVSQWAAEARRFNPNHGAAGSGHGGQFTSGGSGGSGNGAAKSTPRATAAKKAKRLPSAQPNGLGYSAAQWRRLQKLEAAHAAGKKLTVHELHELHVAHEKHEAHLAAKEAAARKNAARRPAGRLPAPKTAAPAAGKGAPRKAPVNNANKYFAGHPVKGA